MSVTLLCPNCAQPVEFSELADKRCPRCLAALPSPLVTSARAALGRERPPKPLLVRLLALGFGFWALVAVLVFGVNFLGGATSYTINGEAVTREEFLRRPAGFLALLPVMVVAAAAAAWALVRERRWGRPAALGVIALGLMGTGAMDTETPLGARLTLAALTALLFVGPAAWYFYGKRNVVAYYRALTMRDR